jgi:protein phosphatase
MASKLRVTASLRTDTGRVRGHNEDWVGSHFPEKYLENGREPVIFVVADGVGGASAGEIASQYATDRVIANYFAQDGQWATGERLRQAMQSANDDVRSLSAEKYDGRHMATTAVVAVVEDDQVTIGNVGDSRAYIWHDGEIRQVTRDHSLVAQLLEEGAITEEEAINHPRRNVILYSLGSARDPKIDLFDISAESGDILLLCSDGLTRHVSDAEIADLIGRYEPDELSKLLIDLANERGGHDNISVAIVAFTQDTASVSQARVIPVASPKQRTPIALWAYTLVLALAEAALILAVYYALNV